MIIKPEYPFDDQLKSPMRNIFGEIILTYVVRQDEGSPFFRVMVMQESVMRAYIKNLKFLGVYQVIDGVKVPEFLEI
jgi:hypothetical protein